MLSLQLYYVSRCESILISHAWDLLSFLCLWVYSWVWKGLTIIFSTIALFSSLSPQNLDETLLTSLLPCLSFLLRFLLFSLSIMFWLVLTIHEFSLLFCSFSCSIISIWFPSPEVLFDYFLNMACHIFLPFPCSMLGFVTGHSLRTIRCTFFYSFTSLK